MYINYIFSVKIVYVLLVYTKPYIAILLKMKKIHNERIIATNPWLLREEYACEL